MDILPLLSGPVFEPLLDLALFSAVGIDPVARTVVWPTRVDLAPEALYELQPVDTLTR